MHFIYDLAYILIYLVSLPWLIFKKIEKKQSFHFFKRIFGYRQIKDNAFFWIHGASVGELNAASKIIDLITKFGKSFNELTIDTVKGFLNDSKKSRFNL